MARVRIEWLSVSPFGREDESEHVLLGVVGEFDVTSTHVEQGPAPLGDGRGAIVARVTALDGPVLCAWGALGVVASSANSVRIEDAEHERIECGPGAYLSFIIASADAGGGSSADVVTAIDAAAIALGPNTSANA